MITPDSAILNARILVVDDHAPNLALLKRMLGNAGYRAVATEAHPAAAVAAHRAAPYDLILLDIQMPGMDGFDVMAALEPEDDYLPVIVLTAYTDRDTRLRALEAGARDFLGKPFDHVEVLTRIRNMLEVRLLHRRVRAQNRELEEKVRERTRELHDTRLEVIRRLGRAAEYRDNETGLHIIRMSKYSELLGRAAGMDDSMADTLLNASPMHDIGKIGIPDHILQKPGRLTAEEWAVMQTHPAIGAEILSGHDSPLMAMAREIALHHHEKWDGSGYPGGLAGEDIPLAARVVAVADVFDALTTVRPYKPAWSVDDAVAEIRAQRGRHFDPHLVDLFCDSLADVLEIRARYREPDAE
jgi:putative two-component system response regulator